MNRLLLLSLLALGYQSASAQLSWQSFDVPGATATWIDGIDGENIIGSFYDGSETKGFLYNRQTEVFNILQAPNADWTLPLAISNGTVVGSVGSYTSYARNGFAYSSSGSWSLLNPPEGVENDLEAYGIDGANIVGGTGSGMSFVLNGSNWIFFNSPFDNASSAEGISGSKIVGTYFDYGVYLRGGYIKENENWTRLNVSGAAETIPRDVDGNIIIGEFRVGDESAGTRSFLFDGANWTYLDAPLAISTFACGIDGNTIVGSYNDTSDVSHGFILTVPAPAITSSTSASAIVGTDFTYSITASGAATSYNASDLPPGFSVNTSTGVISGTPSSAGTFTSSISGSNFAGTGSASLTIAIAKGTPTITVDPTASTITYGQTLASSTLSGGSASVAGNFAWTTLSTAPATGTSVQDVTFTPTDTANYNTVTTSVSVTVNKATPVIITTPTAALITPGQTLASSSLGGGLASVTGSFNWTRPSTIPSVGTSRQGVTFTPTETANYNTVNTTVNVVANPAITSNLSAVTITLGSSYSYQITGSGSPTSFGVKGLPTGLKVDARTGLISGKAAKVGVFSATLQALKNRATTATATKVFTVVQIPTFSYVAKINAPRGKAVKVVPKIAGYPAPTFSILSGSLPPGLSLNASTAAITGKPPTAGSYAFTVRGSNSAGNTDRSTTIVVK